MRTRRKFIEAIRKGDESISLLWTDVNEGSDPIAVFFADIKREIAEESSSVS